jgi:hypothetical protein
VRESAIAMSWPARALTVSFQVKANAEPQQELLLRSGRHLSQLLLLRLGRTHPRSARRLALVRLLRPSACSLRFFPAAQSHCTSATNVVNTNAATFWHLGGPIIPGRHALANITKLGSRCAFFFNKNDLTTFFANVTCAAIGDRIVSVQRRGGSLGGSIRRTIFHSSFPSFSVSTWSAIRFVWRAYAGEHAVEGADYSEAIEFAGCPVFALPAMDSDLEVPDSFPSGRRVAERF